MPEPLFLWRALAVLLLLCGPILVSYLRRRRMVQLISKIPGTSSKPILGNVDVIATSYLWDTGVSPNVVLFRLMCGFTEVFRKEKMFRFWICSRPVVMLYSPDTVEAILTSNKILEKSFEYRLLHPWLGTGLLTSSGCKWRGRRKMLTPAFHFKILEDFAPVLNEQSRILIHRMKTAISLESIDAVKYITLCTLDIICETAMGVHVGAQGNCESEYVKALYNVGETFLARAMRPWLAPEFFFKLSSHGRVFYSNLEILHNFTRKVIRERKEDLLKKGFVVADVNANYQYQVRETEPTVKRKVFLDLLLDVHIQNNSISEEEIREEVDTFMFEGHDTTAMGLSWALYLVGRNPHVQDKVQEELDYIFGDDKERSINMEDMRQMKYLECVIKEAQRLYPSVPYIGRELQEDFVINGYTIPKGTTCCMFFYMLHRDPEIFPNPEVFEPERFSQENSQGRNPFAYTPFSAGPRNCIGQKFAFMEEKIVLANIFRNFRILSLDPRDVIHTTAEMVIRPKDGIRIKVQLRDS